MLTRRHMLTLGAAGLLVPRGLAAPPRASDHHFLFVFCTGGWDITKVFAPVFDSPNVEMSDGDVLGEANGVTFCDHPDRPSVRDLFERWGDRACIINGLEARSIAHERCMRLMLTGSAETGRDDWSTLLAGASDRSWLAPNLVLGGTAFGASYPEAAVRVGKSGQLEALVDGSALTERTSTPVVLPSDDARARADAFLRRRLDTMARTGPSGARRFGERYDRALARIDQLDERLRTMDLTAPPDGCQSDTAAECSAAFDCFQAGIARCAMVENIGACNAGWDTHVDDDTQIGNFESLFAYLGEAMDDLDKRTASDGVPLLERVTIVVMSEMGRTPRKNQGRGRDHWTYTSVLLLGGGVRGGRVVGGMDADYVGKATDLASGEPAEGGTSLLPGHLGATLLTIGGIDPVSVGVYEPAITAVIA